MKESHSIDAVTCTKCELCVIICPSRIIEKTGSGEISFQPDRIPICIQCGHCMAMCESKSISIEGISYEENFRELPQVSMDHESLLNFLLTRRSVRVFKNKPVPVEVIEKILEVISTAPFGVSPDNVEITAITDKSLIEKAAPEMSKVYIQLEKAMKIPVLGWMIRKSMPREAGNTVMNFIVPHLAKNLYKFKDGVDDIARNAPAILLFHAPKGAEEHTVDAHIYLTYALLAAHSLGLGATAIGLIGPAINQSKQLRTLFRIPIGNEVVESMILGYPKLQFKRAIVRPRKNVRYIS
jgi:nitroreductase/Pyruvate/2-oxoacid:ferredoxin oxidoreductase delta subunit